jgi:hypothetical protein
MTTRRFSNDCKRGHFDPFRDWPRSIRRRMCCSITWARGLRNVALGPVQAALEQVAPDTAKELTRRINEFDEQLTEQNQKHPVVARVGDVMGTVLGIGLATSALSPVGAAIAARTAIPAMIGGLG